MLSLGSRGDAIDNLPHETRVETVAEPSTYKMKHQPELFSPIKMMKPFETDSVGSLPSLAVCFEKDRG